MAHLTRDAILAAEDIQTEEVLVPQWGGTVRVRGMSGTERDAWEAAMVQTPAQGNRASRRSNGATATSVNTKDFRAKLCAMCVVDEAGARMFSDEDVEALGAKSGAALDAVFGVAMRLSGLGKGDVDKLAQEMLEGKGVGGASS